MCEPQDRRAVGTRPEGFTLAQVQIAERIFPVGVASTSRDVLTPSDATERAADHPRERPRKATQKQTPTKCAPKMSKLPAKEKAKEMKEKSRRKYVERHRSYHFIEGN